MLTCESQPLVWANETAVIVPRVAGPGSLHGIISKELAEAGPFRRLSRCRRSGAFVAAPSSPMTYGSILGRKSKILKTTPERY